MTGERTIRPRALQDDSIARVDKIVAYDREQTESAWARGTTRASFRDGE